MNKRHVLPILLVAMGFLAAGSEAPAKLIPGTSNSLPQLVTSHGTFKLGKKPYPKGTREQWIVEGRVLARAPDGYLPREKALKGAADNRSYLPPIGDQSSEGSCVHWAGSYYTKTANMKRNNPAIVLTAASNQCSPRFTYNLSNAGADNGGYGHEPFEIFMRYGGASLQQKPYVAGQYTTLPTMADFVEGLHRRTTNYVWVWEWDPSTAQINELKAFLDAGGVAVCGVYAEDSFDAWGPGDAPWVGSTCTVDDINHMVTVCGYGTGYYLVVNQWGTSFGSNGFIVVNSSYFENYFSDVMYPLEGAYTSATHYAKIQIQHPQRSDIRSLSFSVNGATAWSNSPLPKNLPKGTGSFDTDTRDNWQLAVDLTSASWGAANTVTARCMDQVAGNAGSLTNFTLRYSGTDYVSTDTPVTIPNNTGAAAVARVTTEGADARVIGVSGNLAFGSVTTGQTATATMTITNSGTLTLTVSSISYPSGFSGAWSGTIAAGGSRAVTVTFAPVAVQSYGGTVTVNSDMTSGTSTLAASGTGISAPSVAISPATTNVPATALLGRQLSVVANVAWTASTNVPWLWITGGGSGSGNGTVTFGVSANAGTAGRTGTIMVAGGGIVRTCTVAQAAAAALNTYYRDADGDLYGDPVATTQATVPPFGYVANGTDCDDGDGSVHPGASEVCSDGVDNDCDGQTDEGCVTATTYFSVEQWVACTGSGWSRTVIMDLTNYQDLAAQDGYQGYWVYYPLRWDTWTGIYLYDYDTGGFRAVTWLLNLNL